MTESGPEVQQLRDQMWQLRNEVAATEARATKAIAEAKHELDVRLAGIEDDLSQVKTYISNQRTRHASTPQWLFGLISATGTLVAIYLGLRAAGIL